MLWVFAIAAVLLATALLTGLGSQHRSPGLTRAMVSGIFFPITWAVWYVRDEHPYARASR